MTTIPKLIQSRVNRFAHASALRYEMRLRDRWTAELSAAMERKAGHAALLATLARMEASSEGGGQS